MVQGSGFGARVWNFGVQRFYGVSSGGIELLCLDALTRVLRVMYSENILVPRKEYCCELFKPLYNPYATLAELRKLPPAL